MRRTAALAISITLAAPGSALAQSSGYGSAPTGAGPTTPASANNQLPFTGMDSMPLVAGGVALLLLGAGLAHSGRGREER
ncbi:MAG: hypothetical protein JWN65_4060 [Solirubrobacterales bacterium]|jgi:hypothetical protein|nr:hypothetical protein [Solirubrobacterales bacterium]